MKKRITGFMRVFTLCIVLVLALSACSGKANPSSSKVDPVYIEYADGSERYALQNGQYVAVGSNKPVDSQPSNGYAYYNGGTLYLNNYVNEQAAFVFGGDSLTIHLLGKNAIATVSDNKAGYIPELKSGTTGSLVIDADKSAALTMTSAVEGAAAISVSGSVQINGGDIIVRALQAADDAIRCEKLTVAESCTALASKEATYKNLEAWDGSTPAGEYSCFLFSDDPLPGETTLVKLCGVWCYLEEGKPSTNTTLVKYNGKWYYVSGGTTVKTTTLVKYNGAWWYVKDGMLNNENTLCKFNGKWYHVNEGKWVKDTTLVKYNGAWWYVQDGILNTGNTLCKYNGKWFHVNEGQWVKDTTLVKYNKTWWYIKDGLLNTENTLCEFNGSLYHVNEGKWVKDNTLVQYNDQWYYVNGGLVDFEYNGEFEYDGEVYTITNGVRE